MFRLAFTDDNNPPSQAKVLEVKNCINEHRKSINLEPLSIDDEKWRVWMVSSNHPTTDIPTNLYGIEING